ncbi:MAG: Tetratricopeptide repeat protein [Verrucomicrobia bacterium]|nr:Tetratricopeptide repeat protein [Verrucomicrobiota bacterium]
MPESTTPPNRAVFLSYAREDAGAAKIIAEALRRAGVEVWFDQSELRGGDAWDQKIRREIRDCALFVPLISATTQGRPEGYFRREWRQAVDRTRDMASGVAFILPIVIDDTSEKAALAPEEFLHVQWTRLPDALPTPEFVRQVKQLLESPRASSSRPATHSSTAPIPSTTKPAPKWPLAVGLAAVIGAGLWFWFGRNPPPPTPPEPAKPLAESAPAVADKSIAVLPFANMSEDKDTGFFADGVHEDLLTNLATVAELKVISRTSVMQYRGTTKTIRQIGKELGVAYLLEGSVRRAGNQVRVTGQLINTRTDEHVWAKAYDRSLTDIFSIQAALAQEIAGALSAAISPETKKSLERRPTDNPAAYDLFLQARNAFERAPRGNIAAMQKAEEMYQAVVDIDPKFAEAWGELANIHALNIFWGKDTSAARLARGEAAIAKAQALAPDAPEIIGDIGTFAYYAHRDYVTASKHYARLAQLQPNNALMHHSLGLVLRRQGRWAESLVEMQRALKLEPANYTYVSNLAEMCYHLRRWDEVRTLRVRLLELTGDDKLQTELFSAVAVEMTMIGSDAAFQALWARLTPAQREKPIALYMRKSWAMAVRDTAEFRRLDALVPSCEDQDEPVSSALIAASYLWSLGERTTAAARIAPFLEPARERARREPNNPIALSDWGFSQVLSGHPEEGLAMLRSVMELLPTSVDAMDGPNYEYAYLEACALTGHTDLVLAGLPHVMREPTLIPPVSIPQDACFFQLRDDPRFQAILRDPANNRTPLF